MKIKINIEFDLKNPFDFKNLKNRIRQQFYQWQKQSNLNNLKIEFSTKH